MRNFPAVCIDNFYERPDEVREYALSLPFDNDNNDDKYPGKRTQPLHIIHDEFFQRFCGKLLSVYYDINNIDIQWEVITQFQLIGNLSEEKHSPKNTGWIHTDGDSLFGGVIFLTPNIDPSCGLSIFNPQDKINYEKNNIIDDDKVISRSKFHSTLEDDGNYDYIITEHNSKFIETMRFNNEYNRLVSFDGNTYHGVTNYYSGETPRLTQVFFVRKVTSKSNYPLTRIIL